MSDFPVKTKNKKLITVFIVIAVIAAICLFSFGFLYVKASTDNIYTGIHVGELDIGGMDKKSAVNALKKAYDVEDINVKVKCEDVLFDIYGSSFALKVDYEQTVDKALSYGKDGTLFSKIANMLKLSTKPCKLELSLVCDYNVLQYAINEKLGEKVKDVEQYSVEIGENELIVFNGKSGSVADAQKLLNHISKAMVENRLSETLSLDIETVEPDRIDADKFIKEYNRAPRDATVVESDGEITITPEIVGVKIDEDTARSILKANKKSSEKYTIPAEITYPEITSEELEAQYLDTVIGSYSSDYSTSSQNRKTNIHLASSKINGITLNPGEVFSFNNVVGPRTQSTGFKIAHVYSGGKVVDGIGGGICQVSSTLYNAVVLADLEIVYRTNHTLPVSYVPLGRDATVSYGTIDFKVKNNKETPIKFEILHDGKTLTVNVYGRGKYLKDISVETAITGYIPYTTTEVKDDTMYEGETKVIENGSNGTKVEAYKIVKENGEVVSRTLLSKSSYTPTTKVVRVGTKKKETPVEELPVEDTPASIVVTPPPQDIPSDAGETLPPVTSSSENMQ